MAIRRRPGPQSPDGFFSTLGNIMLTLMEDGPRELRAALEQQEAIEAEIEASVHLDGHLVGPARPLGCLGLRPDTVRVLLTHWAATSPRDVLTVGGLLALDEVGALEDAPALAPPGPRRSRRG